MQMDAVSLSSDFWDGVACGKLIAEPRLAVLTQKSAGSKNVLLVATDGSRNTEGALQHGRIFARGDAISVDLEKGGATKSVIVLDKFTVQTVGGRRCVFALSLKISKEVFHLAGGSTFTPHPRLLDNPDASAKEASGPRWQASSALAVRPASQEDSPQERDASNTLATPSAPEDEASTTLAGSSKKRRPVHAHTGGAVARQKGGIRVNIKDLNSYSQDWVITGRVADKTDLRLFANQRGESQVFSATIIDRLKGEIRASFFGGVAARWHPRLEVGRVYEFSRGTVDVANRKFNSLSHEYEIKFDDRAQIVETEEDSSIPSQIFSPVKLATLARDESLLGTVVDVVGFVTSFSETSSVLTRNTREELQKKELTLVDDSDAAVSVTLWEQHAASLKEAVLSERPLVAIKALRVSAYADKVSLTSTSRSVILVDPQGLEEGDALAAWWHDEGERTHKARVNPSHSSVITDISVVNKHIEELTSGSLYFNCLAVVSDVQRYSPVWLACPECRRKVRSAPGRRDDARGSSFARCLNCNKTVEPVAQWSISLTLADPTGSLACVALNDCGQQVVGPLQITPETVQMLALGGTDTFGRTFGDAMDLLLFREVRVRLCVRSYKYRGDTRVTCKVVGCTWTERDNEAQTCTRLRSIHDQLQ